jgi:hypothetical protein
MGGLNVCNKSESISKIAAALVAFSGEIKSIEKDGTNPHFKSSYTTLDHMIDVTKPILHKHGLNVMQFLGGDGERITCKTMVIHESGEWIESDPFTVKAQRTDPQGAGSASTYSRRYSYSATLSLSLGDDDDGNAASQPKTTMAVVKSKYQLGKGSLEGFDEWAKKMTAEGQSLEQMDEILTKALMKKERKE